jgi:hypothetical protein
MHTPFTLWMNFSHVQMICITDYDCVNVSYTNIFIVCMFMTYSTSYCLVTLKDLWNVCTVYSRIKIHLLYGAESFLRNQLVLSYSNSPHIMELKGSVPQSQVSATCPYPEPAQSSPFTHIPLPEDPA